MLTLELSIKGSRDWRFVEGMKRFKGSLIGNSLGSSKMDTVFGAANLISYF